MRFWFIHSSEVTIREQIVTQVKLGILSGELAPAERLPSTRELGRRFSLHPNTVSAAYQQLESEGWVASRKGSGVFVRETKPLQVQQDSAAALDHLFHEFLHSVRTLDIADQQVRDYLRRWTDAPLPTNLLLVEPEAALAKIVMAEIGVTIVTPLLHCTPDDEFLMQKATSAIVLVLPSKAEWVKSLLPGDATVVTLNVRSVASSLADWLPASPDALVAIASGWPPFLDIARTLLVSAGFSGDALLLRETSDSDWQQGLDQTSIVVCDLCTAQLLPSSTRKVCFSLLADETVANLRAIAGTIATTSSSDCRDSGRPLQS